MAKTIILKDIDNNICYPKTIKNNIYGLVSELNEIKQAIGIEPPNDIIVLFKGSAAPSTTMSDFGDNVKLGDLYLKTSTSKTMYYVSDTDAQNDIIAWTALADQNSVSGVVQNILAEDTQAGASLGNNAGFISALAANNSFASEFLRTTGASYASTDANFGSAIARNPNILFYWFGSVTAPNSNNFLSYILSAAGATTFQSIYWDGIFWNFSSVFAQAVQSCFSVIDERSSIMPTYIANTIGFIGSQFSNTDNQELFKGVIDGLYTVSASDNISNLTYLLNKRYDLVKNLPASSYIFGPTKWYYNLCFRADKIVVDMQFNNTSSGAIMFSPFGHMTAALWVSAPFSGSTVKTKVVIDPIASIMSYVMACGSAISSSTVWFPDKTIASYAYVEMSYSNVSSNTFLGSMYLKI